MQFYLKSTCTILFLLMLTASYAQENNVVKDAKAKNDLLFMLGTWKTSGTQDWGNGTMVKHKGIVKCRLLEDGVTIERTFWAAFDNGASLGGKSTHEFDADKKSWYSQWIPTSGEWVATPSVGRMEGKEYVEVGRGTDANGNFMSRTRVYDISADSYSVSTDLVYDSGKVSKNNWNIHFEKIKEEEVAQDETKAVNKNLQFLVGDWMAEGKLKLPNGTYATHCSFVDAQIGSNNSYEREFWGAISVGGALRGQSVHKVSDKENWNVQWIPKGGAAAPVASGTFDNGEFIETYKVKTPSGTNTIRTKYYAIRSKSYKVQTDVIHENGKIDKAVWTVQFKRI